MTTKADGRAAVVVPENVLVEGDAGEPLRRQLLHEYDVHTRIRLPSGDAHGGKANVTFVSPA